MKIVSFLVPDQRGFMIQTPGDVCEMFSYIEMYTFYNTMSVKDNCPDTSIPGDHVIIFLLNFNN